MEKRWMVPCFGVVMVVSFDQNANELEKKGGVKKNHNVVGNKVNVKQTPKREK